MGSFDNIAAIFAHPDDEVLGAGGALAKHALEGASVHVLILATGLLARTGTDQAVLSELRRHSAEASAILGVATVEFADFPDNRMDSVPLLDIVQRVESFISIRKPERLFTHHAGDLNVDHRIVHDAVLTACRPLPHRPPIEILAAEVNSSTEWGPIPGLSFEPTVFLDVSATLEQKVAALECYRSEIRAWPHPRSVEGIRTLARWRGSQCGREAAEAFRLCRRIEG